MRNYWMILICITTLGTLMLVGCTGELVATPLPTISSPSPIPKQGVVATPTFAPTPTLPRVAVTPIAYPDEPIIPENAVQVTQLGILPPPQQGELIGISDFTLLPVSSAPEATDKLLVAHGFKEQGKGYPTLIKGIPVWDIATGQLEQIFGQMLDDVIYKFALSADGQTLISSGVRQASVSLWDFPGDQLLNWDFVLTGQEAYNLALSSDGQLLAVTSEQAGGIGVYGIQQPIPRWPPLYGLVHNEIGLDAKDCCIEMVFSSDGHKLASVGSSRDIYLWDMTTGELIRKWPGKISAHYGTRGLSFSLDGRLLAAPDDEAIKIWDVENGTLLRQIIHREKYWVGLAFSPDGRLLAAGTRNYDLPRLAPGKATLQLWEVETGQLLQLLNHPSDVTKVAFSHDGKLLISGATDGVVRLWGVSPAD